MRKVCAGPCPRAVRRRNRALHYPVCNLDEPTDLGVPPGGTPDGTGTTVVKVKDAKDFLRSYVVQKLQMASTLSVGPGE